MSFKSSYYFGYDEVPSEILNLCSHFFIAPYICNRALFIGVFPDRLKYAIVRPLFKKGNKNCISNYGPISILTSFSKIFEKLIICLIIIF